MPEEVQAQCEAMHDQMEEMMGAGGMMGGDMSAHRSGNDRRDDGVGFERHDGKLRRT